MLSKPQPPTEATVNEVELPVIDISQFLLDTDQQALHHLQNHPEVVKLREACKEWGFFRLVNHGIPFDHLQNVQSVSRELLSMPTEAKDRATTTSDPLESYFRSPTLPLHFETFCFTDVPKTNSVEQTCEKIWPQQGNSNTCDTIRKCSVFLSDLAGKLTKLILASLGLDVMAFYQSDFQKCRHRLRINNYLFHGKSIGEEALGSHADPHCLTILYQDDMEGLEIRSKEGQWLSVKPESNSFVVNLGSSFKAWSNGRYRSADHRVVYKGWANRMSIGLFYFFPDDEEIWAPAELIDEENPRRYKPFIYSELKDKVRYNSADNERSTALERFAGI